MNHFYNFIVTDIDKIKIDTDKAKHVIGDIFKHVVDNRIITM